MRLTRRQAAAALVALHFGDAGIAAMNPVDQVVAHARSRGCIQFDPLDVVGRNPDLMLQSRVEGYSPRHLERALYADRRLIDGFDKNLAIFAVEDFPHLRRLRDGTFRGFRTHQAIEAASAAVLDAIDRRGPLCSDDLDMNEKVDWPWGKTTLARAALESLWVAGRLVIHHKKGVRRYYDRIERHLPAHILAAKDPNPRDEDYYKWQVLRRIRSVGLMWNRGSDAYLCIDGMKKPGRDGAFQALLAEGAIEPVEVDGVGTLYAATADLPRIERAAGQPTPPVGRVIAPLDNLMWDRRLIEALFGFRYRWEVYVPADKREYGYYVLPVMLGDRFAARFEPSPWRGGPLSIKNWWWETEPDAEARQAIDRCMGRFEAYLQRGALDEGAN
ncbi:MAG: hypothetical protein GX558_05890 [Clostridiales bacterium]|nr:hypothetical protein [Clostridiales bacterium]